MSKTKGHVCSYKHCLHYGVKVTQPNAVCISKRWYHQDCFELKNKIKECADKYVELCGDATRLPAAYGIIQHMVFKGGVPIDYIKTRLDSATNTYYKERPVFALYGIRTLFWTREMVDNIGSSSREGTDKQS